MIISYREELDYESLRHKVLGILVKQRIDVEIYHVEKKNVLGVEFKDILKELNISREELFIVVAKLRSELEVDFYSVDFKGYFAKPKGVVSYFEKKYLKITRDETRGNIKFYIQSIIPAVALIIAGISIGLNIYQVSLNKEKQKDIENIEEQLESLSNRIYYLEEKTKNSENESLKKNE